MMFKLIILITLISGNTVAVEQAGFATKSQCIVYRNEVVSAVTKRFRRRIISVADKCIEEIEV